MEKLHNILDYTIQMYSPQSLNIFLITLTKDKYEVSCILMRNIFRLLHKNVNTLIIKLVCKIYANTQII